MTSLDHTALRFVDRHVGPDEPQQAEMLKALGFDSLEQLMAAAVPGGIRSAAAARIPPGTAAAISWSRESKPSALSISACCCSSGPTCRSTKAKGTAGDGADDEVDDGAEMVTEAPGTRLVWSPPPLSAPDAAGSFRVASLRGPGA